MLRQPSICDSCAHLDRNSVGISFKPPRCNAFPDGIPVSIWINGQDHRDAIGDEVIVYDMQPGYDDALAAYLERQQYADQQLPG